MTTEEIQSTEDKQILIDNLRIYHVYSMVVEPNRMWGKGFIYIPDPLFHSINTEWCIENGADARIGFNTADVARVYLVTGSYWVVELYSRSEKGQTS